MAENSTDDNSNVSKETLVDMDDLDKFEAVFYGRENITPEEHQERVEDRETEDDSLAPSDDKDADPEDNETSEEDDDKEPEAKPEGKKNRKSAKERIEELVAEARSAERERDAERQSRLALEQRLAALEQAQKPVEQKQEPTPQAPETAKAPDPNATNDKGEPVYPLGEFDPAFIRDLTRFTVEQETVKYRLEQAKLEDQRRQAEEQARLRSEWEQKVQKVKEELPDYQEQVTNLVQAFGNIEPQYGDYLASTIMQCDNGPEIMYYLSQNIGEAQKIVASGPFAATLAIGRLQARLERPAKDESNVTQKKVSEAPTPPTERVRGRGGQFAVRPDTDDLDAFEKEFFNKPYSR